METPQRHLEGFKGPLEEEHQKGTWAWVHPHMTTQQSDPFYCARLRASAGLFSHGVKLEGIKKVSPPTPLPYKVTFTSNCVHRD